jgi:hypothetical protein
MKLELEQHNITVLSFNTLFAEKYQLNIANLLRSYNLIEDKITSKDVTKIFYHSLIHDISETLLQEYAGKPLLVFNSKFIQPCDLTYYYDEETLVQFLIKFFNKLEKMLPIKICVVDEDVFALDVKDDKVNLILNGCIQQCCNKDNKSFTLEKIKKFAKKYDLTFLDKDYLNRFKTKLLTV